MHVEFKMKYIQHWTDDLGRERYRFRRKGYPRVELPVNSDPSSPEFQAAYHAALRGGRTLSGGRIHPESCRLIR